MGLHLPVDGGRGPIDSALSLPVASASLRLVYQAGSQGPFLGFYVQLGSWLWSRWPGRGPRAGVRPGVGGTAGRACEASLRPRLGPGREPDLRGGVSVPGACQPWALPCRGRLLKFYNLQERPFRSSDSTALFPKGKIEAFGSDVTRVPACPPAAAGTLPTWTHQPGDPGLPLHPRTSLSPPRPRRKIGGVGG